MTWSDVCSTYAVFEKSLDKKAPNHASMNKFGITWQAFSILRVLQPIFFSQEYSTQLNNVCGILDEQRCLTVNRFQYLQVLADECSTAMLKQLPIAYQDSDTNLSAKDPKKGASFANKSQIKQVFSSEVLRHLLLAYTIAKPAPDNFTRIQSAIQEQTYQPTILLNIWEHLDTTEAPVWTKIIDKALFFYVEYLVDFCRVNAFRTLGMPFIDLLAKRSNLTDESLRFHDSAMIVHPTHFSATTISVKSKHKGTQRFQYAMKTGLFENKAQAQTVGSTFSGGNKSRKMITVPITFEDCLKQITYQSLYAENNPTSPADKTNWWNMFNISTFVSEFETKASNSITARHDKLQCQENKPKEEELIIIEGSTRKRTFDQLVSSFDSISNKRQKKQIFEKTLAIVLNLKQNKDTITKDEAVAYKEIMQTSSSSKSDYNKDQDSESLASSEDSDDDASSQNSIL